MLHVAHSGDQTPPNNKVQKVSTQEKEYEIVFFKLPSTQLRPQSAEEK